MTAATPKGQVGGQRRRLRRPAGAGQRVPKLKGRTFKVVSDVSGTARLSKGDTFLKGRTFSVVSVARPEAHETKRSDLLGRE